ncbi:MAG: YqgE/AlgH family protein [Succinivibrionaceae bacterium]
MISLNSLKGKLLIANPHSKGDSQGAVILVFDHRDSLVHGVSINRIHKNADQYLLFDRFLKQHNALFMNDVSFIDEPVFDGGPHEPEQGLILNNCLPSTYMSTLMIMPHICATTTSDILLDIVTKNFFNKITDSNRYAKYKICLGKFSWSEENIEEFIKNGRYFVIKATEDLVFYTKPEDIYHKCLAILGSKYSGIDNSYNINFDDKESLDENMKHLYWIEHVKDHL